MLLIRQSISKLHVGIDLNINVHCERRGSKHSELTAEPFFPLSYETLNQRGISGFIVFFSILFIEQKMFFFIL